MHRDAFKSVEDRNNSFSAFLVHLFDIQTASTQPCSELKLTLSQLVLIK